MTYNKYNIIVCSFLINYEKKNHFPLKILSWKSFFTPQLVNRVYKAGYSKHSRVPNVIVF